MGLSPAGVLEEDSLMAMVSQWQNSRLKNREYALPDQLLTAPTADFYDPERFPELRQVERNTYAAYKQMVAAAIADSSLNLAHTTSDELAAGEKFFKIISAFRSREYQDELRRKSPNAGSAGLAVNSPHFTGRALDIYVGGDPVDTRDSNRAVQVNTPAYKWLVRNAGRFGFRPYFYEPWHWEYVR
jgi:LAS superfamily LD-carboxypeptidase LdcB